MCFSNNLKAQCNGSWTNSNTMDYLCANGPFLQQDLGANTCPASAQATYAFTTPVHSFKLIFSAFGTINNNSLSRMAVFLNNSIIDLNSACKIMLGCQTPSGTYSISGGCLVDNTAGSDGGISGYIYLYAASFGLTSITSIGVAVSEPFGSGTIFQIDSCDQLPSIAIVDLGNDTILCNEDIMTLDATTSNASYLWQDNSTNPIYTVTQQGIYWVNIITNNCTSTDTISITSKECNEIILEMPNVFSPNNDGVNDYFYPKEINGINQATLIIYNRWGAKLFETNNILTGWDGKYNGKDCSDGTYFWIIQYTTITNESKTLNGSLTLLK